MLQLIVYLYIDSIFIPKFMTKRDIFYSENECFCNFMWLFMNLQNMYIYVMHERKIFFKRVFHKNFNSV